MSIQLARLRHALGSICTSRASFQCPRHFSVPDPSLAATSTSIDNVVPGTTRHVVAFKFAENALEQQKTDLKTALLAMPQKIGNLRAYEYGASVQLPGATHDVIWQADFSSVDEFNRYAAHPAHVEVVENFIKPILHPGTRVAVQYTPRFSVQRGTSSLRHVVLFRFKKGTHAEQIVDLREAVASMSAKIGNIRSYQAGVNLTLPNSSHDAVFHADFASIEEYEEYSRHPALVGVVEQFIRPVMEPGSRVSIQYEE